MRQAADQLLSPVRTGQIILPIIETFAFDSLPSSLASLKMGTRVGKHIVVTP